MPCLVIAILLAACAPAAPSTVPRSESSGAPPAAPEPSRKLVVMIRVEPATLAPRGLQRAGGVTTAMLLRLFNAGLAINDDRGQPNAYLAEALPQLETDTWRVLPDGRMETAYRLRADLTWHDEAPLTAADFAFSWQVYATPELGAASSLPFSLIEEVAATDQRTVLIRWRRPFPDAGSLQATDFPPLPRHLLEQPFQTSPPDSFVALPFWARDYVGAGPYRLAQWEPGAFMEATAFGGHTLGRGKIPAIRVLWNGDPNTVLANLAAGDVHVSADDSMQFTHATILRREWSPRGTGTVLFLPTLWRSTQLQLRPELAAPRSLQDVRMRRAFAHAVDKQALNDTLFEGQGIMADSMIPPTADYFAEVDRAVMKYPHDPRRTEQLMNEVGYSKGPDGFYTSPDEGRLATEVKINAGAQYESEMSLMAAGWRQAGFDVREVVNPAALAQDGQTRALFPALYTASGPLGEDLVRSYGSANIPRLENRWVGRNRVAWINPEFDRLVDAFNTTLDRSTRNEQVVRMARLFSEELPEIALYFDPGVLAYVAALQGPRVVAPKGVIGWDIHQWEFR